MNKKVAIFGDSWSFGSCKKMPNMVEGRSDLTWQTLFADTDYSIDNYSIQGGTNNTTLDQIRKNNNYDLLIIFQTDPVRQYVDCASPNNNIVIDTTVPIPHATNFEELCTLSLRDFYLGIKEINKPVLLIGGCTKLCFEYVPESFITLSQSWSEMVAPGFKDNYYYWVEPTLCLYEHARKKFNWSSTRADFFEFEKQILDKNHLWQTSDYFSWCHAADPAYKIMFEKIKEVLNDNLS